MAMAMVVTAAVLAAVPRTARAESSSEVLIYKNESGVNGYYVWLELTPASNVWSQNKRLVVHTRRYEGIPGYYPIQFDLLDSTKYRVDRSSATVNLHSVTSTSWVAYTFGAHNTASYYGRVYDAEGKRPGSVELYIPQMKIDSSAPGVSGSQNTAAWATSKTISVNTTDDRSGVTSVTYTGPQSGSMSRVSGNETNGGWRSGSLTAAGAYTITATDQAGNQKQTTVNVTNIDRTGPTVTAEQETNDWAQQKAVLATVEDSQSGVSSVFWSKDDNAASGTELTRVSGDAASGAYRTEPFREMGAYYIRAKDALGNLSTVSEVQITKLDQTPPAMTGIQCKNAANGFQISFTLEDTESGMNNATVQYGSARDGSAMAGTAKYNSLKGEYSFLLPPDGKDYYIFAADKVGNEMAPVMVPRLWLPHTADTGIFTNDGNVGEAVKEGEQEIETYGYIGNMPKTGVDVDEDGQVDAIAPESDMISVTVPMNVVMYASWDNFRERQNFVSPNSMVVNNNLSSPVHVQATGFEPQGAGRTINLVTGGSALTENDIAVMISSVGTSNAFAADLTQVNESAPLDMGVLAGGEGAFYTFEADYVKGLVQQHKGESLICRNIFRFARA